ncbi:MAG: hypothetical protein WCT28_02585 [Patescibacteria group bacterium]
MKSVTLRGFVVITAVFQGGDLMDSHGRNPGDARAQILRIDKEDLSRSRVEHCFAALFAVVFLGASVVTGWMSYEILGSTCALIFSASTLLVISRATDWNPFSEKVFIVVLTEGRLVSVERFQKTRREEPGAKKKPRTFVLHVHTSTYSHGARFNVNTPSREGGLSDWKCAKVSSDGWITFEFEKEIHRALSLDDFVRALLPLTKSTR